MNRGRDGAGGGRWQIEKSRRIESSEVIVLAALVGQGCSVQTKEERSAQKRRGKKTKQMQWKQIETDRTEK